MAHFAEIDSNNKVLRVMAVNNNVCLDSNGQESEAVGQQFLRRLFGGNWIQTSYTNCIRKNYAGVGMTYDRSRDAFIALKPLGQDSWVLNEDTCRWEPPIPYPTDGQLYEWNERSKSWVLAP